MGEFFTKEAIEGAGYQGSTVITTILKEDPTTHITITCPLLLGHLVRPFLMVSHIDYAATDQTTTSTITVDLTKEQNILAIKRLAGEDGQSGMMDSGQNRNYHISQKMANQLIGKTGSARATAPRRAPIYHGTPSKSEKLEDKAPIEAALIRNLQQATKTIRNGEKLNESHATQNVDWPNVASPDRIKLEAAQNQYAAVHMLLAIIKTILPGNLAGVVAGHIESRVNAMESELNTKHGIRASVRQQG